MPPVVAGLTFLLQVTVAVLVPGLGAAAINAAAAAIGSAIFSFAISAAASRLFAPDAPPVPRPEDGKYNFKQAVPSLAFILGRVEKGGDYVLLEEKEGIAYHITVPAGHSIQGYFSHRLHDEDITLDVNGDIVSPKHFVYRNEGKVNILTRTGAAAEVAYSQVIEAFPEIWTEDHRGDGLASVLMRVKSVSVQQFRNVFPQQMPQHKHVIDGNDQLYDPRTETYGFTTNLALFRFWHLTHPVGGKLKLDDMYLPEWKRAADVCDDQVLNRDGESENRYHGGFWFRANNSPVEIGRMIDQAAELVVYERPDGKIGVHAGEFVLPDVRLTEEHMTLVNFDANRRQASTVLAVRGQYTNPDQNYTTADAAIFGDPYIGDNTERTRDVRNTAVQSHNHISRLQKLAYKRANAPRVSIVAEYEAASQALYSRFVRVHLPPRMNEAVVEIIGQPKKSLRNLTVEFQGIVVSDDLYDFDAPIDEGQPPAKIIEVESEGVPAPVNFDVVIQNEVISGGGTAAFALARWDFVSSSLSYELEWLPSDGGTRQSVLSSSDETTVRSAYLIDGQRYSFRLRTVSGGITSEWTDVIERVATADPTPPGDVQNVSGAGGTVGDFTFNWTAPNSQNYLASRLYLGATDVFEDAILAAVEYGAANEVETKIIEPLDAGDYYGWVEAINASGVPSQPVETGIQTVL